MSDDRKRLEVRVAAAVLDQVDEMASVLNISRAAVVALAIGQMHAEEGLAKRRRSVRRKTRGNDHSRV